MYAILSLLLIASVATAFQPVTSSRNVNSFMSMVEKSKALPFLPKPAKLDGTSTGDFGFDPLGLTDTLNDLNYVKASELKHGRVAMLATVGFVFQQYVHFASPESNPFKAITTLGYGPNLQVLFLIGCIELATWDKTFSGNTPGNYGFDPLGQTKGKSAAQIKDLELKEIKNGRLAMIAFIGMAVQSLAFDGKPTLEF